ncbi:MAG: PQQ-binding-like beta-propeller repeat protein [Candidatus Brocadiia bacterium]
MGRASHLLGIALAAAAATGLAGSAEWPGWRGPNRDGKSPDTGLLKQWPAEGPEKVWQVDGIGSGFSSVAVAGGLIYITGDVGDDLVLFAFDLDGQPRWKTTVDKAYTRSHPGSRSTPTIDDGDLYLLSGNGVVACYDARSGKKQWARHTREFGGKPGGWGYAESVLIYHNLAIVKPGGDNCIVALEKSTGKTKWTSSGFSAGPEYSSCIALPYRGGHLVITGTREGIVCVNARNGRLLWSNDWCAHNTANCPTPAYADDHVFWANGYGKGGICIRMELDDGRLLGKEAWTTRSMNCHHGGYIIHQGYIHGNDGGGWTCLELKTGRKMWHHRGVGKGSMCWADDMLYLFGESGGRAGLATCSPRGMEMRGEFRVQGRGPSWAHPVVIGGRLYLRYDSHLYCFDVRARQ